MWWHQAFFVALGLIYLWCTDLVAPQMWDLSSLTRSQSHILYIGRWILNHWTTSEVLDSLNSFHLHPTAMFIEIIMLLVISLEHIFIL